MLSEHCFPMLDCPESTKCPYCRERTTKIISVPGVNTASESSDWIKSITEVVNKDGGQHCQAFLKDPTRANYKTWMAKEGVRHVEHGEQLGRQESVPEKVVVEKILKRSQGRRSLCLRD